MSMKCTSARSVTRPTRENPVSPICLHAHTSTENAAGTDLHATTTASAYTTEPYGNEWITREVSSTTTIGLQDAPPSRLFVYTGVGTPSVGREYVRWRSPPSPAVIRAWVCWTSGASHTITGAPNVV